MQVDAPFVFRGDAPDNVPPRPEIIQLRLVYLPKLIAETQDSTVLPPSQAETKKEKAAKGQDGKPASKGFFGRIKSFFGSVFK